MVVAQLSDEVEPLVSRRGLAGGDLAESLRD
jgi:hypothetical protein